MEMQPKPMVDATPVFAWGEWMSLMGYAGIVALAVSTALAVAVVLLGN